MLKTHESTRKLARRLEQGSARIMSATITRIADCWHVSFTVEVQRQIPTGNGRTTFVGVDVGIRQLAVVSNGAIAANPNALQFHARAAAVRRDALHKLTTDHATNHGTVVVEHLNVAGMMRNRRLARALADTGMSEIRRQLSYKTTWYGSKLVVADPFTHRPGRARPVAG